MTKGVLTQAFKLVVICAALAVPRAASAFGPLGHRIAGLLAEPALCPAARDEIAALGRGESLAELGLWADTIRGIREWQVSAPWHFMNVEAAADNDVPDAGEGDDALKAAAATIRGFRSPPEGDVLSAIERFRAEVADRSLPTYERAVALKFLVHFVVDVHQPLHVGRAADRGGNQVDVRYGDTVVNLHRFWDSDVLELRSLGAERYARRLRPRFGAASTASADPPAVWAAESLALRSTVYAFGPNLPTAAAHPLDAAYRATAQQVVEERLVRASQRLAATLNDALCGAVARRR
jgi:hypothetical protein